MYTIDRELLYDALTEICYRIEKCGASDELTDAVSLTSALCSAVGNQYNPPNPYSLIRVIETLNQQEKEV